MMFSLEDVSSVPICAYMLVGALQFLASISPRSDPVLRTWLIQRYADSIGVDGVDAAKALAIGWRLDAVAAFLISPAGVAWRTINGAGDLLSPYLLDCAANEPLIRGKTTAVFDNGAFLSRLASSIEGLNDSDDMTGSVVSRH
jgi:hypothetical protein